ncbi:MAG: hypothetical protein US74_C0052G0010 [Parcubacteria group bacterium GW2011_GWA2_38_13]|nr:MAG: hypothetical protein US74_C0052G0010 [Parcubacteria group bacterium GW2011_GWA2_38_13]
MNEKVEKIIFSELSFIITGICYKIHNNLGRYRNEQQYCDAMEFLLKEKGIKYEREKILSHSFPGEQKRNIPDFIIENTIIVDFKAKDFITRDDYYQMKRYLVSLNYKLGIIYNFRQKILMPKRVLNSDIK